MNVSKVFSCGVLGIEAYPVEIEVDVAQGLPAVTLVGMADTAIRESRERVKSAIKNSGFSWPGNRITISLAPSGIKKEGASFDLGIAAGILAATGQINTSRLVEFCLLGELALDGGIRPTRGILPIALYCAKSNRKSLILARGNAKEAGAVSGASVWPLDNLKQLVNLLHSPESIPLYREERKDLLKGGAGYGVDFSEVKGQHFAKRAIEVAVAGGHNIILIGPPGSGKTMLAKRIPTIMPDLVIEEALDVTRIHSVSGNVPEGEGIIRTRPFRAPHHSTSNVALVGGGSIPQPGEISLAHQGVLFLDELPEFNRNCLESLRQPLEDGNVRIARIFKSLTFPSSFMLVCAMNPCPCGYYTDPKKPCRCAPNKIAAYMGKISGPLLDRIDLHVEVPAVRYKELSDVKEAENSAQIKERVEIARSIQRQRLSQHNIFYNARMGAKLARRYCLLEKEAQDLLRMAMTELNLSARAYDKILKVSRTIADLAGVEIIQPEHISEAIQYRSLDRQWPG